MYLKRVELAGFKSFADRTEFEFVPGITAVVGPNGSGKSNITDAIRWVLGEQSAKSLRGAKMEDVIFAGSDSRKPVNFSEVSLTLNNEDSSLAIDYSEVTITRRLYRSGDSEYYINKQPVRLKDITELLMDTGLGKEAYSIIGQGKIEEILSSKPEDRRGVFEEAAGIVKYKTRKREAKKRLEETEQNLIRINDLIHELEGQIEPLEAQAAVAKEYKGYAEQLKDLNIKIYVHDIEKTYAEWQETDKNKKILHNDQVELSSQVSQIDALIENKRWSVNKLEKELDELHQSLVSISEKVEQAEGKKEVLNERERNHQLNKTQSLEAIEKLLQKKAELNSQLTTEQEKLSSIDARITELMEQLAKEEDFLNQLLTDHESQIEVYKNEYFDCLNGMATLRNDLRHISTSKESITYRIDKLNNELEQLGIEEKEITAKEEDLNKEFSEVKSDLEAITLAYNENILNEKNNLTHREEIIAQLKQKQQRLDSLISRHEVLTDMQNDFSGFHYGVKEILKQRDSGHFKGVHGAIAELIEVPKQYETAIEVALGSSLQYIVVETEEVGRKAINYLKERKLGRSTFLPLDVINGRSISSYELEKIERIDGFIGLAIDLIEVEEQYSSIAEFLLGQLIVASDLKQANYIAKALGYSKRVVTLDGDIVNPGGSMTGGSVQKKNVSILGRQREIDELAVQIEQQKQEIASEQKQVETIEASLEKIKQDIEGLRINREQKRLKEQELIGKNQQLEYESKNIANRSSFLNQELKQLQEELEKTLINEQEFNASLAEKAKQEAELQTKIAQAESFRKQDESVKLEMNEKITNLKIDLARFEQERDGNNLLIERLTKELSEIITSIDQHQENLILLENELTDQQKNKETIKGDIEGLRLNKDLIQKKIDEIRLSRSKLIQEIETEEQGSKELRKNLKVVESGYQQCEVKLNRLDVELENLLQKLAEEYEMSYEWAKENVERIEDVTSAKEVVKKLKLSIQALGEVNIGAIEEFERVSERFNFLSTQKTDLVEAKETLYQVIEEVDVEMNKRFKESYDAIREQFQQVFTKLFGGGRADLILTDENNLLETGIEIVAQPPGKKLQNLALLSGGEKALTAITLLFAILRVKPVPFCVLDEVEAALDEANVTRFSEYLREFCELTQFIVVTHRKGTMEGADVLYGVTMQESGVSRLVSVKLDEKEQTAQLA